MTEDSWLALPRDFYHRDPLLVAPDLLNKILARTDGRAGRIVEVEAYRGADDAAAHSFRGLTRRNATMFGPCGHLYVYFNYGMHWCANVVCASEEVKGSAVLVRAIEPLGDIAAMRQARRNPVRDRDIGAGPARLTQALGIDGALDGADLVTGAQGIRVVDDGTPPPLAPVIGPRIGISKAVDNPWRWHVAGHAHVSRPPARKPLIKPAAQVVSSVEPDS